MKLKEILAISGQPGLFRFIAQSKNGIIVEALADEKRSNVSSSSKVSSMGEISVYTEGEDEPLANIFKAMYDKQGGKEAISHKSTPEQLKAFFGEVLPTYDRERVHVSDMKKIISWYNILTVAGFSDFSIEEDEETGADVPAESADNTAKE